VGKWKDIKPKKAKARSKRALVKDEQKHGNKTRSLQSFGVGGGWGTFKEGTSSEIGLAGVRKNSTTGVCISTWIA